jgi:hypothetical protein
VGAAVIASGCVVAALALPWLYLLPVHGAAAVLAHALTLVAAFHGAGLVIAWLAGQRAAAPLLIVQWGAAALIGLSGLAIAAGAGTLATHAALVFGAAAVHTGVLGVRFTHHAARAGQALAGPRTWLVPAALLGALGVLAVLGAAGDSLARPFDDEGHVIAQLRRVLDTGALADPIGYPRRAQLGGQIALAAVASGAGDGVARIVEALAAVLALGLAVSRIRARDPDAALWATVLIATAFGLALAPIDPLPCWTAVGETVALYAMLGDPEPPPALPFAITAGALLTLRHELVPVAAVALLAAWVRRRGDLRRTAILIGGVLAVAVPFLVARTIAWRSVPAIAQAALVGPPQPLLAVRLLIAAAIAAPAACVLRLALPGSAAPGRVATATATAVGLGGIAAHLTSAGPYGLRLAWPVAIAFAITLVIELARTRSAGPAALIPVLVMCVLLHEGREAPGRLRWSRRLAAAATSITYLEHPPGAAAGPYDALLASVPPGATVAVWVAEPERLDYARHRIVDLRTPAGARLRGSPWGPRSGKLAALLAALPAAYALIEDDDAHVQRTQSDVLYRFACPARPPACADELAAIALGHRVVARGDRLALVELGARGR